MVLNNKSKLQKLINEIVKAQREYHLLAFDEEYVFDLGLPATFKQIEELEDNLGKPLPSDYRAFLELHNGWSNFHGDGKLLSVEDHSSSWVKEKIKYWNDLWDENDLSPFENGAIPILLGESLHHFITLDPVRIKENGKIDFVDYDYMHEYQTYEDFITYLSHELDIIIKLIDREIKGENREES